MKQSKKHFEQIVKETAEITHGYQIGLKAFGQHSKKILLNDNRACEGSVDIDTCTQAIYPESHRWDYCFSYKNEIYFVEVHSADTGEVSTVENKLRWLKNWLQQKAPEINKRKAKNAFYWIQSNGFHIKPNSPQFRRLVTAGLKPISKLEL